MSDEKPDNQKPPVVVLELHDASVLERLHAAIAHAFDRDRGEGVEAERGRFREALAAMAHFLEATGAPDRHCTPFAELAGSLEDLNHGRTRPLLQATNTGTRPRDPMELWIGRAALSAAITVLAENGMSRPEAAQHFAKRHNKSIEKLATQKSKNLGSEKSLWLIDPILGWEEYFRLGKHKHKTASSLYPQLVVNFRAIIATHPQHEYLPRVGAFIEEVIAKGLRI